MMTAQEKHGCWMKRMDSHALNPNGLRMLLPLLLFLLLLSPTPCLSDHPALPKVLILHSYHKGLAWTDNLAQGIDDRLAEAFHGLEISHEYMDTKRHFSTGYLNRLADLFQVKYAHADFDAIISTDDHAFNFLRRYRHVLFSGIPVVFCGVNDFEDSMLQGLDQFTGVLESFEIASTLNTALKLHPQADRLVIILDQTLTGRANKKLLLKALPELDRQVAVTLLDDHTMSEVQQFVAGLSAEKDIVFWLAFTADRAGRVYSFHQSVHRISEHSQAPLYSFWDFHLGHGIVGGKLTSGYHQGEKAAEIALRILNGEPVSQIPPVRESPNQFMFDYTQLERFGIDQDLLPPDSIIINTPASLYAQYAHLVWIVGTGFALLGTTILILLTNNIRRRHTEAGLQAAHDRYQNVFNATAVALFEVDASAMATAVAELKSIDHGNLPAYLDAHPELIQSMISRIKITDANPAAVRLYGATDKSKLLAAFPTIFRPDRLNIFKQVLTALAGGRTRFEDEAVHQNLNGRRIDVIVGLSLPSGGRGFQNIIISIVDISSRKRSEEALRFSEDRFRTIFDHAASGMALVDLKGNYLRVNASFCRIMGYSEQTLLRMNWRDVTHHHDIDATLGLVQNLIAGNDAPPIEKRYLHKDGRTIWALMNAALIMDDRRRPIYYIAQMQDITQIKTAQAKLREKEERYRQIFEADLSGFYIVKPDGELIMCNQVFAKMLGYDSVEELLGIDFKTFYKDPAVRPRLVAELEQQKKLEHCEVEFVCRDGRRIYVLINAIGRFNEQDRLIEIQGYLMDITRQKTLEAQLLHAQKMESIGTMAGGVAHDFNNLLMGIMGNASLLMLDLDPSHQAYSRLQNIEQHVHSGSELTRQLLGFAKGGKYEVRTTDLNRLIQRNIKMFARTHKNIQVDTTLAGDLWPVEADRSQIDQVLYNLYVNAWQAMQDGGELHICTQNKTLDTDNVQPYEARPGRYIQITVSDTGHGMDEATLPRIFDPFFTTKERERGTGLGLASGYGIIKNHNGFITVQSRVDQGTTFYIYLPASDRQLMEPEHAKRADVTAGSGCILLVDDEEIVIEAVGGMLSHLGYTLFKADSGPAAIDIFRQHHGQIDLVILDMVMPGMSGGDTFEQLKAIDPGVKILLSSGYSADGQAGDVLQRGCVGFIQKPFTISELSQRLYDAFHDRSDADDNAVN